MWNAAERFLRSFGEMAEAECEARASYHEMRWDWASASHCRRLKALVQRLKRGERPPLKLEEAVLAGRFHDFLAQQGGKQLQFAALEAEVTQIIRKTIRQRMLERHPAA